MNDYEILKSKEKDISSILKKTFFRPCTSKERCLKSVLSFFPILEWLPKYDIQSCLFLDIVAGVTTGVLHVTQGIAYAILCKIPPVNGLYMSLLSSFVYMFFGTSRTTSLGKETCV